MIGRSIGNCKVMHEVGRGEIWVRPYSDADGGDTIPLSSSGGQSPIWSRDGKELFYLDWDRRRIMAVAVPQGEEKAWGSPEALFNIPNMPMPWLRGSCFEVAGDGRFIFAATDVDGLDSGHENSEPASPELHVVLNWFEELKRKVPTGKN